jgi:hypothetical protein
LSRSDKRTSLLRHLADNLIEEIYVETHITDALIEDEKRFIKKRFFIETGACTIKLFTAVIHGFS